MKPLGGVVIERLPRVVDDTLGSQVSAQTDVQLIGQVIWEVVRKIKNLHR
jgi:hypothetical protein